MLNSLSELIQSTVPKSLFTFFALQAARIQAKLYPVDHNPPHSQGPRRPDLQEQEAHLQKVPTTDG